MAESGRLMLKHADEVEGAHFIDPDIRNAIPDLITLDRDEGTALLEWAPLAVEYVHSREATNKELSTAIAKLLEHRRACEAIPDPRPRGQRRYLG